MPNLNKIPSTYEHPHVPFEYVEHSKREAFIEDVADYPPEQDDLGIRQIPESPIPEKLPTSGESITDVPSRFTPRSAIAGLRRWFAQRRTLKSAGPFGPANSELFNENGELREALPPEGTIAERHPDWPDLKVNLFLSRHVTEEDYKGVKERLANRPDILLYEGADGMDYKKGRSSYTRMLEALSEGRLKAVNPLGREGVLLESVQGSGVKIGSIDTTKTEQDSLGLDQLFNAPIPIVESYDATLDIIKDHNAKLADAQNKRDAIMVKRFEHEIGRILEQNPKLKEKKELSVLIPLGSYHTKVGHGLRRMGVATNVEFEGIDYEHPGQHSGINAEHSYVYDHANRLQRSLAFGREPSRELVEKTYAGYMLTPLLPSAEGTEKSKDLTDYRDSVVSALESEDIQAMHESSIRGASPSDIQAIVNNRLAAKGLPLLAASPQDISSRAA